MGGTHKIFADLDIDGEVKGTSLDLNGNAQIDGTITVGQDDTGYDVKFFLAASGRYIMIDEDDNSLLFTDNASAKWGNGGDLQLMHDGTDSRIDNMVGHLKIRNYSDDSDILFETDNGSGGTTEYLRIDGGNEDIDFLKNAHFLDNVNIKVGSASGGDLQIYHNASHSLISNQTGNLIIRNQTDDGDITFQADDGSGGDATYLTLDGSAATVNFSKNIDVSGQATDILIGDNLGAALEFKEGSNLYMRFVTTNGSEAITLEKATTISSSLQVNSFDVNGATQLDGALTIGVDDTGHDVKFYGATSGKYLLWDESDNALEFTDSTYLYLGSSADLKLYHDGSASYIENNTGNLNIMSRADDADLVFWCDDGSGGDAEYFRLDGSANTDGNPRTKFPDNSRLMFGAGDDMDIFHNGTNSFIRNNTTSGDLIIQQSGADKDIILKCDDGSGGETAYITLDGSTKIIELAQITNITTDTAFRFGHASTFIEGATSGSKLMLNGQTDLYMRIGGSTVGQFDASNFICTPKITADAGIDIDNFNIDGTTITLSSGDMTLDPAGDMIISMEDGSNIDFKNGGNVASRFYAEAGTASTLFIYENGGDSSSDYCSINVATHGATTISTVDGAAAAAHFTLDVDGNIELNADGGTITFADAGSSLGTITSAGYSGTSAVATSATITANNTANETVYPVFVDGATGTQGLESDTGLTYNPSTGVLTSGKLTTDVAEIVENNKSNSALMTLTGQGAGNEANIGLKLMGTSNGNPIKLKMKALDSSGGEVGAGLLSYDADDDSFAIGQNSNHNRMAIQIENTITSPSDGGTYVYYEPTGIKAREYVASSNSTHYDFQGDIIRNGNDTTVRGKMYCYKNGTWTITNADTKLDANGLLGIALGTNSTTHGMLLKGTFTLDYDPGGAGNPLYLHTTDGLMDSSAPTSSGHIVRIVGYLLGGTHGNIFFDPDKTYVEIA